MMGMNRNSICGDEITLPLSNPQPSTNEKKIKAVFLAAFILPLKKRPHRF